MVEPIQGVLSETILNQLASDLGVEPKTLREHPFFEVLRDREVVLTYPLRISLFPRYELINILLGPGEDAVLEAGIYTLDSVTDTYGDSDWSIAEEHFEIYAGGSWREYFIESTDPHNQTVISDGENFRIKNSSGANSRRAIGIRMY